MVKRVLALCLGLALLCGCSELPSSAPSTAASSGPAALFSADTYPVVDGSTATLPLMAQVMADTCGILPTEAEPYCTASKTTRSWERLLEGDVELLLVYEAPEALKPEVEKELEVTPIGRDALVFIVNEQNPVESLTRQQLIDIYAGRITNWSEVGGNNEPIVAFQRDENSGSQTLFKKLLMGDEPLMDAPIGLRPAMMGGLIDGLASYNDAGNALGYSVYYYASEMYAQPGLKFLAVDGVAPAGDTIGDKTYPLTNEFYAAIRKDTPSGSPTRTLYDWVCGPEGKAAIEAAGYVPVT